MLKTNKRGFTLVEVLCSLAVFSIIFVCMMSYEVSSLNMKKDVKNTSNNVIMIENLKNNILYSMTFEELNKLKNDGKIFVKKADITLDENGIIVKDMFTVQEPALGSYMKLTFLDLDANVYKLNISLYSGNPNKRLELQCSFYKGNHK